MPSPAQPNETLVASYIKFHRDLQQMNPTDIGFADIQKNVDRIWSQMNPNEKAIAVGRVGSLRPKGVV